MLVIDKPAGLAVHEGKTVSKRDSVIGILERQYRASQSKPQLVHRLDQDTSGVLMVAKNLKTAEELALAFETGAVDKEYLALVVGRLANDQGKIDMPLPGREGNPVRALTRYQVVKRYSEVTSCAGRHRNRPPASNPPALRPTRPSRRHGRPAWRLRL